jgi:hypothetical protein
MDTVGANRGSGRDLGSNQLSAGDLSLFLARSIKNVEKHYKSSIFQQKFQNQRVFIRVNFPYCAPSRRFCSQDGTRPPRPGGLHTWGL